MSTESLSRNFSLCGFLPCSAQVFKTSPDVFDFCGRSPVLIASALGHIEMLQDLILVHKAQPHMISPVDGATAMMLAARGGHAEALMVSVNNCSTSFQR